MFSWFKKKPSKIQQLREELKAIDDKFPSKGPLAQLRIRKVESLDLNDEVISTVFVIEILTYLDTYNHCYRELKSFDNYDEALICYKTELRKLSGLDKRETIVMPE